MTNNAVLVLGVQQSDSDTHIHSSILSQILFPFKLLHNIEQSFLCYTVSLCWISTLNIHFKFWLLVPFGHITYKYFLPFCDLSLHFVDGFFVVQQLLSLSRSHLFIFVFISITPGDKLKKILLLFVREYSANVFR